MSPNTNGHSNDAAKQARDFYLQQTTAQQELDQSMEVLPIEHEVDGSPTRVISPAEAVWYLRRLSSDTRAAREGGGGGGGVLPS